MFDTESTTIPGGNKSISHDRVYSARVLVAVWSCGIFVSAFRPTDYQSTGYSSTKGVFYEISSSDIQKYSSEKTTPSDSFLMEDKDIPFFVERSSSPYGKRFSNYEQSHSKCSYTYRGMQKTKKLTIAIFSEILNTHSGARHPIEFAIALSKHPQTKTVFFIYPHEIFFLKSFL